MEERPPEPLGPDPSAVPPPPFGSEPPPPPPPPPPPDQPPAPALIPWERSGVEVFGAFIGTIRLLLSSPRKAFEMIPPTGALGRPFAFAMIVGLLGVWGDTFWRLVLADWWKQWIPTTKEGFEPSTFMEVGFGLAAPLWIPIVILVAAALQHVFLFAVGGARSGFRGTFRAVCYSWAPSPLALIPICGQLVGSIWGLVLGIIGLAVLHKITYGRAALAVFLPLLLCCGCIALALALFGAAIFAALQGRG